MGTLSQILSHSRLLGWATRLLSYDAWAVVEGSLMTQKFRSLRDGVAGVLDDMTHGVSERSFVRKILSQVLRPQVYLGLTMLLMLLLTLTDTGIIGLFTWLLAIMGAWFWFKNITVRDEMPLNQAVQWSMIDTCVVLYFLSAVLSTVCSSYLFTSLLGLKKALTFAAGYGAFRMVVSIWGRRGIWLVLGTWMLLGFIQALIGFYQYKFNIQPLATWQDPTLNPDWMMTRVFGTLQPSNPNLLAGFLVPCLAASLGWVVICTRQVMQATPSQRLRQIMHWVACAVMSAGIAAALVLTGSRGGYLAIAAISAGFFAMIGHLIWHAREFQSDTVGRSKLKIAWVLILVLSVSAALVGILGSEKIRHRIESIGSMRADSSISYRLNVYQSAVKMIAHNPLVGIGPGNETFKQVYGLYMIPGYNALGTYSVPLEIWVEQGVIGFGIFALLMILLSVKTMLLIDRQTYPLEEKWMMAILWMILVGSMTYGLFDTIWYRPAVQLTFWFTVAAMSSLHLPALKENNLATESSQA
ncbi:MAG: O-antigen ligase family protein [Cyanobacteria bacterium]|nr:O-antigen ligase family protein [Cyanobacteriota bacterium]